MNIVVDDLLTHYQLQGPEGKGKLVLILHGWGDSLKGHAKLQTTLAQHYQVLAIDLPGFGGTQLPATTWKLDDYARFVKATLDKLELKQPYALIGHSNGGAVSIRGLSLGVLKPQKLILLAASGVRLKQSGRKFALKVIAKTGKAATIWLPYTQRQTLRKALYDKAGSDMLVVPELEATYKQTIRQDVQADAATITIPTLLVNGSLDQAVPLAYGERYHALIKDSKLEVLEGAGHFVHIDQAAQVEQLIQEFLK